jgi:serine phosphatase RsbU (regulator of sigma subunit)
VATIEATGAVIGWDADDAWDTCRLEFASGASLVLYTDGLTEAKNEAGEEFGEERLVALLDAAVAPEQLVARIHRQVEEFSGSTFADDLTMFIMKRKG